MSTALLTRPLLDRAPPWVLRGNGVPASLDFDFVRRRYWQQGRPVNIEALLTTSRASIGYVDYVNGIWCPIAANIPRISDKGLLVEEARTNDALWSRDMTNTAWVKVNMTTAKTATGIDGAANSASNLTAAAGNATILQTLTLTSQADTYSVWLKRVTGTGEVDITVDGGTTWTAAVLTAAYKQFQVTKTAANPIVGIRIVVNGDAVAADFNQLEPGAFATSPILTTSATVTRAADNIRATIVLAFGASYSLFGIAVSGVPSTLNQWLLSASDGTSSNRIGVLRNPTSANTQIVVSASGVGIGVANLGVWTQTAAKFVGVYTPGRQAGVKDGGSLVTNASALTPAAFTRIEFGAILGSGQLDGYVNRAALWPTTALPNAAMLALTT